MSQAQTQAPYSSGPYDKDLKARKSPFKSTAHDDIERRYRDHEAINGQRRAAAAPRANGRYSWIARMGW